MFIKEIVRFAHKEILNLRNVLGLCINNGICVQKKRIMYASVYACLGKGMVIINRYPYRILYKETNINKKDVS